MSIIEIKKLSKKYYISDQPIGYLALRDLLASLYKNPFSLFEKNKSNQFYALDNVDLSIEQGDVLGVVGSNGAGKSTLLKILSKITPPTSGKVIIKGKVASLLEVGTGFHPELTGRENIFLNGAILGMSKNEITNNFDKIVEFSGVGKFLNTPIKHYSSGMYVRLAFSVAAHMNSDILLVDEVLAVGDMEFQKKCLSKINDLTKDKKRTVIFVSHNLNSVQSICNKCVLIEGGKIKKIGKTQDVINDYLKVKQSNSKINLEDKNNIKKDFDLISFELANSIDGSFSVYWNEPILIKIRFKAKKDINYLSFIVGFKTLDGLVLFNARDIDSIDRKFNFQESKIYTISLKMNHNLSIGTYGVAFSVLSEIEEYANYQQAIIEVVGNPNENFPARNSGVVNFKTFWNLERIES